MSVVVVLCVVSFPSMPSNLYTILWWCGRGGEEGTMSVVIVAKHRQLLQLAYRHLRAPQHFRISCLGRGWRTSCPLTGRQSTGSSVGTCSSSLIPPPTGHIHTHVCLCVCVCVCVCVLITCRTEGAQMQGTSISKS